MNRSSLRDVRGGHGPSGPRGEPSAEVKVESRVPVVTLKKRRDKRIRSGHLWVFSNEIEAVDGTAEPGDAVYVRDAAGRFVGTGYLNPHSLIAVRLVSRTRVDLDAEFLKKRIADAVALRERLWPGELVWRAVYSEADLLPGLIVDRYGDTVVVQSLTAGMERRLDYVLEALKEILNPRAVVLRNDSPMRRYENLPAEKRVAAGSVEGPVEIEQDGCRFLVDVVDGQKTGFFLDQRENRRATAALARNADVLDCCCYTGAWSVYALRAGATNVTGIDSSGPALELAARNLRMNGATENAGFVKGDVFKELAALRRAGRSFGLVVADPPAFAKSRKRIREALKAYRGLNRLAMSVTSPGGHLVTCTCSHLVEHEAFMNALVDASREAGRRARVVEIRGQSRDHPVVLGLPETRYLTCVVLEIL
ncbi:MAG: methyltransferase domain-containing protein [Candidatus Eisenbacteria bacterium]|nr:methyltransferase domain-containing protein [Candidatus Eisenbacteria bacterium]